MSEIGVLQNDPTRALRDRLEPGATMTAQDSLTLVLSDLHEAARSRLADDAEPHRRHRRGRRASSRTLTSPIRPVPPAPR
jgi:hypothetical protein